MSAVAGIPLAVTDFRSNRIEHVMHAVESLGKSAQKLAVFEAVYYHKQRVKSVSEIVERTGLSRIRVLQVGNALVKRHLIGQTVKDTETAYTQDPTFQGLKKEILNHIRNPQKREKIPTKRSARVNVRVSATQVRGRVPKTPTFVTVDSIDSFSKVRGIGPAPGGGAASMSEDQFKEGVQGIIGETGRFKDWGGEQNDIFTTNLVVARSRRRAAFAFKGPGKRGMLRPRDMGVNGDQIQRLFRSPADVFIIQYHGQIHESVVEQMDVNARLRAAETNASIWYGIINGIDSNRLIAAYPDEFAGEE